MKRKSLDARSLLAGLAAGAGIALAINAYFNRRPERALAQRLVNHALDRTYKRLKDEGPIRLGPSHRYVIFSDHHKGGLNRADDFRQCRHTYLGALDQYDDAGYTLILLGDVEELMEEPIDTVMGSYPEVFHKEARFHPGRLIRVFGNHDIYWKTAAMVRKFMGPRFPGVTYREGVLFEVMDRNGQEALGEALLTHGHQGTIDSDVLSFLPPIVLPFYRHLQIWTGIGATYPSQDDCLRSKVDNRMYRWVSQKRRLILIAGHTHRPVWSSKTHLDKLIEELYALLRLEPEHRPGDYIEQVTRKRAEVARRQAKYPPCDDIVKPKPAYFNGGCCRYNDGDITGIELEDGVLRLVKWSRQGGALERTVLEQNELVELFAYL